MFLILIFIHKFNPIGGGAQYAQTFCQKAISPWIHHKLSENQILLLFFHNSVLGYSRRCPPHSSYIQKPRTTWVNHGIFTVEKVFPLVYWVRPVIKNNFTVWMRQSLIQGGGVWNMSGCLIRPFLGLFGPLINPIR